MPRTCRPFVVTHLPRLAIANNDKLAATELSAKRLKEMQNELTTALQAAAQAQSEGLQRVGELEQRLNAKVC